MNESPAPTVSTTSARGASTAASPAALRATVGPSPEVMTNTEALGHVLYTRYFYFFQAAGLILLVAMIGAIVLTLRERKGIRRQDISVQNARTAQDVELRKVPSRQGI